MAKEGSRGEIRPRICYRAAQNPPRDGVNDPGQPKQGLGAGNEQGCSLKNLGERLWEREP